MKTIVQVRIYRGYGKIQHFEVGEKRAMDVAGASSLDDRFWIGAEVPGDVHAALVESQYH